MKQARYWLATWHAESIETAPDLGEIYEKHKEEITYMRGQLEKGSETGAIHWQFIVYYANKKTLDKAKLPFAKEIHIEPTKSSAVEKYVWKDETHVEGTKFEYGKKSFKRNNATDWHMVRDAAKKGKIDEVPADIFVRHYNSLKRIEKDYQQTHVRGEQEVKVYWGVSGAGKSHRAFTEAGKNFYVKNSNKWWDGYQGEENIILEEFNAEQVPIETLLRWLDKWPCQVETKGGTTILKTKKWWITTNTAPENWYNESLDRFPALMRRLTQVEEFKDRFVGAASP